MLCNTCTTLCCSEQCRLLHRCGQYNWVFSWKTFPCTRTLSTVSSSLPLLRISSQQLTMASSRYRIAWGVATCYPFICTFAVYSSDPLEREGGGGGAHEPVTVPQEVLSTLHQEGGGVRTYHTLLQHQGEETGGGTLTVAHVANLGILHKGSFFSLCAYTSNNSPLHLGALY